MNEKIKKELLIVKEQAWKCFEKSRDTNQMEAAASFLSQVEWLIMKQMAYDTLIEEMWKSNNESIEDWSIPETSSPASSYIEISTPIPSTQPITPKTIIPDKNKIAKWIKNPHVDPAPTII
jgi:cytoskeletal protein RodZ